MKEIGLFLTAFVTIPICIIGFTIYKMNKGRK